MPSSARSLSCLLPLAVLWSLSCSAPPAPTPPNQAPVADAGQDLNAAAGEQVEVNASASVDPEGVPLRYIWSAPPDNPTPVELPDGPRFSFTAAGPGVYRFFLEVSDGVLTSKADTLRIAVGGPPNQLPVADAGPDLIFPLNARVALDGSASLDGDGDPLTYLWRQLSGPVAVQLADSAAAQTQFTASTGGEYLFVLTVGDGQAETSDQVSIFVQTDAVNQPPIAEAGPDREADVEVEVVLDGGASFDPEGSPLAYRWSIGNAPAGDVALENAQTATPSFVPTVPGEYVFGLVVDDGALSSIQDLVRVTVRQPAFGETAGMIEIPAGPFQMGSDLGADDEKPVHRVDLSIYWIDKLEVTAEAYEQCVAVGACEPASQGAGCNTGRPDRADHPANCLTWAQADAYCSWAEKRLPTEAEWEKAARGTDGRRFPWGNDPPHRDLLNYNDNLGGTAAAGSFEAGASFYGVLNMGGNVSEWTADRYGATYYAASPLQDPQGPDTGDFRTVRGGNWQIGVPVAVLSTTIRGRFVPTTAADILGFRCARSSAP